MADQKLLKENNNLTIYGKLFFAGIASFLGNSSGEAPKMPIKIRASKEQLEAILNIIKTSKEFEDAIKEQNIPIEKIIEKMKAKAAAKKEFERVCQVEWPL